MSTDEAQTKLRDGNRRFLENRSLHPHQTPERRKEISDAQHPFAAILTCSDSRVVPEIIFDQGLGDLFVLRVAGNIVDDAILETLEYGAAHLKVSLIVVLGHTRCGAVTAVVAGAFPAGHMRALVDAIAPAVDTSRGNPGDPVENAARQNVILQVERLRQSRPTLVELHEARQLHIVGAMYNIETGVVEWLPRKKSESDPASA
jgi:carbonic anhydrase